MALLAYEYDPVTGEFLNIQACQTNPREEGAFIIPANCTLVEPPDQDIEEKAVWDFIKEKWEVKCDYRAVQYYDIETRAKVRVSQIGEEPKDNWTVLEPINGAEWNGLHWELPPDPSYVWNAEGKTWVKPYLSGSNFVTKFKSLYPANRTLSQKVNLNAKLAELYNTIIEMSSLTQSDFNDALLYALDLSNTYSLFTPDEWVIIDGAMVEYSQEFTLL